MPIPARGNAAGCEVGFAVIFGGYQARAGWAGILWPQTVALLLPLFPQLSSHYYPVRFHWRLDPRAEGIPRGSVVWGMR